MLILGVEPRIPAYKTSVITVSLYERRLLNGGNWESNPGPSAPKADIIPLDYYPNFFGWTYKKQKQYINELVISY